MIEKEIYDKALAERSIEVNNLNNEIKYDKLTYPFKNETSTPISFNVINRPLGLVRKIKNRSRKSKRKSRKI